MPERLQEGEQAPAWALKGHDAHQYSLEDFADKTVVFYFYPADDTPGCTVEAIDFTSLAKEFNQKNAVVIGVSPDSQESHMKFIEKHKLNVILLCDEDNKVAQSYAAYGEKNSYGKISIGIIRSTFIIQSGKIIKAFYNVRAAGHAERVLKELNSLS